MVNHSAKALNRTFVARADNTHGSVCPSTIQLWRGMSSRGQLQPEYYLSIAGIYTSAAFERKLADLASMEYVLAPATSISQGPPNRCRIYLRVSEDGSSIRKAPLSRRALDPIATVSSYIAVYFMTVEHMGSWVVLKGTGPGIQLTGVSQ
jgi:hypothetical protein